MAFRATAPGSLCDRVFFMRVSAFIDGLNLYHSLPKQYRWLNLKKLCQAFLKKSKALNHIYYFTALALWNEGKVRKHKKYIEILEASSIQVIYGNFKKVTRKCRNCHRKYQTFEEKETDVNMGLYLLNATYQHQFDKLLLLTADSDLMPAIKTIKKYFPNKKSHIILPVNAKSEDLKNNSDQTSQIKMPQLNLSLFPDTVHLKSDIISKPEGW